MGDLSLRDVTVADLDILFEYGRDPEAVHMAAFTHKNPSDRAAFDAHWTRLLADASVRSRAVVVAGRIVGSVASFILDGQREVTYWIGREHWCKGLATKALAAFVREEPQRPLCPRRSGQHRLAPGAGEVRVPDRREQVVRRSGFRP